MQRWGKTSLGKQRYRCRQCNSTGIKRRPDSRLRMFQKMFVRWLTTSAHLGTIAQSNQVSVRTLNNHFCNFWKHLPKPVLTKENHNILVVDGVGVIKHLLVALIAQNPRTHIPVSWSFAKRECYESWHSFFLTLQCNGVTPKFVVCDGQRGLLKALFEVWPRVLIQRCLIHVVRQAKLWLTQNPRTNAGQGLRHIVCALLKVRTRRQKRRWLRSFRSWMKRYRLFLKERSVNPNNPKRWWYTHRKLRATRSLINNSLPDLFRFISDCSVPRTSNHVEGGINSRLKDLLRLHRGLKPRHQQVLAAWYLATKQGQKPTRNFH